MKNIDKKMQELFRMDRNLTHNVSAIREAYGEYASVNMSLMLLFADKAQQKDFWNEITFTVEDVSKFTGINKSELTRNESNSSGGKKAGRKKIDLSIRDNYEWESYLDKALRMFSSRQIVFNKTQVSNDGRVTQEYQSEPVVKKVFVELDSSNKRRRLYSVQLSPTFETNIFNRYTLMNTNIIPVLRKKHLLELYWYVTDLKANLSYKNEFVGKPYFDYLFAKMGVNINAKRYEKEYLKKKEIKDRFKTLISIAPHLGVGLSWEKGPSNSNPEVLSRYEYQPVLTFDQNIPERITEKAFNGKLMRLFKALYSELHGYKTGYNNKESFLKWCLDNQLNYEQKDEKFIHVYKMFNANYNEKNKDDANRLSDSRSRWFSTVLKQIVEHSS